MLVFVGETVVISSSFSSLCSLSNPIKTWSKLSVGQCLENLLAIGQM